MRIQTPLKRVLFTHALRTVILGLLVVFTLSTIFSLRTPVIASAATSSNLNFQARLQSNTGAIVPDGDYNIEFKLYNVSSGGTALWTETRQNSATQGVTVRNGYVTVNLGSITSFPGTINWDQDLYLTMNIGGTSTGGSPTYDGEMNPRLKLTAVPYAFSAGKLSQLNTVTGYTSTLNMVQPTGGDQIFQIPDQGVAGTYDLLTTAAANSGYIQLQATTPGTPQLGNFNISGTGIAATLQGTTSVLTPLLDTASAGTLSIGVVNATSISLGKTTSNITTTVNGQLTVKPATASDTTGVLDIQNAAGNSVLSVDTTTASVNLGKASSLNGTIVFSNATNGNTVTLQSAATTTSYTSLLPLASGAVGQCLAVVGVAGATQTLGYSSCALATGGGYVTLQGATPGTPDAGNFNINGVGIASTLKATAQVAVNPTTDSTSVLQVTKANGDFLLNVNSANGYVINNGTRNIGNEVQNPSFESGGTLTSTGDQGWSGPAQASIVNSSANANSGNYVLQVTPNGTTLNILSAQYMSVNTGDVVYAEAWVKNSAGANGTGGLALQAYDKDKAPVATSSDAASLPGTTYVLRKVTYTVPSGVKYVRIVATVDNSATTGTYYFDDFYVRNSVGAPAVFKNTTDSSTAFLIQSAGAAQTLFAVDTTNNILKVGDSTGSDTDTTIFVLDSTAANPTTNLSGKNGGLFYRSDTNQLKAIIGGTVVDICTTAATCAGYSASASSSIQLQASSPGSQQSGNFNISGTGILSQLQSSDSSTPSSNSPGLVIRTGNATGTTSNSGDLTLDVGTATGTLGQIIIGHAGVSTIMPGMLDVQGSNALKLGSSSSADGSILFRNSVGANSVTLKAAAANPGSSIVLTLPTALGSAGYCLKDTGSGALGFSDCGVGATVTMQNVYDNSSPASILLSNSKDFTITAQDTGTDSSILFNLQCVTSCSTNGRFAVQNAGTDVFVVKPNAGGIVLGVATQIGSATTDGNQYNLQLDSSNVYSDTGSCTDTSNQGAMYYNTVSQSIRVCQDGNGSWSDLISTRDLGLLMFGVVPDSGTSNQGDLPSLVTLGVSGPCKVSRSSATQVSVEACIAYSGGRRVNVSSTTINITGMTTTNIWKNICLTGTNNQPALSSTASASETSSAAGFFPAFNIAAPVACLAQIRGSTGTANNIAQIYDVRTFSTTQKLPMLASTALSLGMLADINPSTAVPSVNGSRRMIGVVVATNGSTSSTSPNVILTTFGPTWVKATGGTAGDFVIQSATNGYTQTNTTIPNNSFNYEVGITPNSFSSTCTTASNCSGSLFVNFQVR